MHNGRLREFRELFIFRKTARNSQILLIKNRLCYFNKSCPFCLFLRWNYFYSSIPLSILLKLKISQISPNLPVIAKNFDTSLKLAFSASHGINSNVSKHFLLGSQISAIFLQKISQNSLLRISPAIAVTSNEIPTHSFLKQW